MREKLGVVLLLVNTGFCFVLSVAFYGHILQTSSWQVQRKEIFKENLAQSIVGNDMER